MVLYSSLGAVIFGVLASACPLHERRQACPQYDYSQQGRNWGGLCPNYETCDTGRQQSPINLPAGQFASTHLPTFNFPGGESVPGLIYNTRFQPQWLPNQGAQAPTISFDGQTFPLQQWHTHIPTSEHTVGDVYSEGEIHFVFGPNPSSATAVVGVRITLGSASGTFFSDIFSQLDGSGQQLPSPGGNVNATDISSNFGLLLNADYFANYWTYQGSLTTPACTEGIRWYVTGRTENFDEGQLSRLNAASTASVREVQPIEDQQVNV